MQIKIMYEENKWTVGSKSKWYDNSNQQIAWIILENQNWILNHLMANKSRKSQNGFLLFFLTGEPTAPLRWRSQLPLCVLAGEEHPAMRAIPLRQVWKENPILWSSKSFQKICCFFCFCGCKNRPAGVPYAKGKFLSPFGKTPAASVLEVKEKLLGVWQFCIFEWCREQRETRTGKASVS